jgi:hypothetical protein
MAVWHGDPWSVFFDVGCVGPDYQPGHAHADTLTLECSYRGQRLFVDPGTYAYDHDQSRQYDRSTAAHNTVCIDRQDSSEVWHIFRVGRRAYPVDVTVAVTDQEMNAAASHTGYDHLPGCPRHTRQLVVGANRAMTLTDRIAGRGEHLIEGGFLLAPGWTATTAGSGWNLANGSLRLRIIVTGPEDLVLSEESRPYHPEFGRELNTVRLCWQTHHSLPIAITTLVEEA